MARRLYRSRSERIISGVCGGLGQYFNIDPVLVRVVFVLLALANGIGIIAYIVLLIIVPMEGSTAAKAEHVVKENIKEVADTAVDIGGRIRDALRPEPKEGEKQPPTVDRGRYIAGIVLVLVGLLVLLSNFHLLWWFAWGKLWPLILVVIGLAIIASRARRSGS
ncbi:MAG: PspC domain-containing protein [Chloroflexi bacterium]|nr:PspC domain-containing protein [Chloroflexota bacterium]